MIDTYQKHSVWALLDFGTTKSFINGTANKVGQILKAVNVVL